VGGVLEAFFQSHTGYDQFSVQVWAEKKTIDQRKRKITQCYERLSLDCCISMLFQVLSGRNLSI